MSGPSRILLVFAREPRAGRVKTRLARSLGPERAAALYGTVAHAVVEGVRTGPWTTLLCHDPPEAGPAVRRWLGEEGLRFRPQVRGGLGERLEEAFAGAFKEAEEVAVVGTDTPGVDARRVEEAFRALERADVVVGPAADGGYYLLALDRPRPALFRDIPWSTPRVLDATLERAKGLRTHRLPVLRDLDTAEDLAPLGLSPGEAGS